MGDTAFVLGNGESRRGIQIEELKAHGTVYACNGVYRTDTPHYLVAVDPKMLLEIGETDYAINNKNPFDRTLWGIWSLMKWKEIYGVTY